MRCILCRDLLIVGEILKLNDGDVWVVVELGPLFHSFELNKTNILKAPDCRTYGSCNILPVLPVDLLLAIPLPLLRILRRIGFARKWHHNAVTALGSFLTTGSQCSWATATTVHLNFGHTSTSISHINLPHPPSTPHPTTTAISTQENQSCPLSMDGFKIT